MAEKEGEPVQNLETPEKQKSGAQAKPSWNHYLGTYSEIFPEGLDTIKSTLNNYEEMILELTGILQVSENLTLVYNNYLEHMDTDGRRKFPSKEPLDRESIFKERLLKILKDNVEYFSERRSWQSGATCFADWTEEETKKQCCGAGD